MKPTHQNDPGINPAAFIVIGVLAFVVLAFTFRILWPGLPELPDKTLRFMDIAMGALIGVIGKTGYDMVRSTIGPVKGDINMGGDKPANDPNEPTS